MKMEPTSNGIYDFIEIGTSDFETEIEKASDKTVGLSVEPIKNYLDRLPDKPNVKKVNCAVSKTAGKMPIYYVHPDTMKMYNLPYWIGGCNSVYGHHPTVKKALIEFGFNNPDAMFTCSEVPVKTIEELFTENGVRGVKYLKIDTEGHDCIILEGYIEMCSKNPDLWASLIKFETNILTPESDIIRTIKTLESRGYALVVRTSEDTIMRRE